MAIIRDKAPTVGVGLKPCTPAQLALMISWGLGTTCYVQGCDNPANTIITDDPAGAYILCEEHYQQGNVPGGTEMPIVFPGTNDD